MWPYLKPYVAWLIVAVGAFLVMKYMLWFPLMLSPALLVIFFPLVLIKILSRKYSRRR